MTTPPRNRIRFTVHYDGRAFLGWQVQPGGRTVQGELERVLSRLADGPVRVVGSGRTDRGVHATGQVAAADLPPRWTPEALLRAANALLPPEVWMASAERAAPDYHPRYDAVSRSYVYRVGLHAGAKSPFHAPFCWPLCRPLDRAALDAAAAALVGDHSFVAFAKAGQEERGDRCTVTEARWEPWGELGVEFHVSANRFLHHMVRYLVGTQVAVARGERPLADVAALLAAAPGLLTSPPAPPGGLFLAAVSYPPHAGVHPPRRRLPDDDPD